MKKVGVFRVVSWYHFLGLCAYLEAKSFGGQKEQVRLVLIIGTFFGLKRQFPVSKLERYANDVVVLDSWQDDLIDTYFSSADEVLLFSTVAPNFSQVMRARKVCSRVKCVRLEEGIGTYAGWRQQFYTIVHLHGGQAGRKLRYFGRYLVAKFVKPILAKVLLKGILEEEWVNFNRKTLEVNESVVASYKRALRYLCEGELESEIFLAERGDLLISSPFSELGLVDQALFFESLQGLVDARKNDGLFYVKPHPVQQLTLDGAVTIPGTVPVEKIVFSNQEKIGDIYGFSSTTCYTLALFLGKKVIRLGALDHFYSRLGKRQKSIIDRFTVVFENLPS